MAAIPKTKSGSVLDQLPIDMTLVVNVHAGANYLKRTMLSLAEACRFAAPISCELLFVMDRSPPELIAWVRRYDSDAFLTTRIIEVDNGSLGLSRNDGLLNATGEVVLFCDEDDLISFNMIRKLYFLAKSVGPKNVVVPEYFLVFDNRLCVHRYFGSGLYSPLSFIADHPFTSRICIHRSVVERVRYSDVRLGSNYAYEDYHFNSKLAALGFTFTVAPDTVIFYREKQQSLLQKMGSFSTKQIPPTPLYDPCTYLSVCTADYLRRDELERLSQQKIHSTDEFFSNLVCLELTHAANAIDPGIDLSRMVQYVGGTNVAIPLAPGLAYYQACKLIGNARFSDVVLLPFLARAGGEKYILNVMDGLYRIDPNARPLVLLGERLVGNAWVEELPKNAVLIDLPSLHPELTDAQIDALTLRLITATAASARVHLKPCSYSHRFVEKFGRLLADNKLYYYRFCDGTTVVDDLLFKDGFSFRFVSENTDLLTGVITDNESILKFDLARLDPRGAKWSSVYTTIPPAVQASAIEGRRPVFRRKIFWLGRLDRQKRPELLLSIAEQLRWAGSDIVFDVYGAPLLDAFDIASFASHPNISYRGEIDGFDNFLHDDDYDALINTSSFEGLPISILGALSAGLPVIAPDVGGVGEVVKNGETGFLVKGSDDSELVRAYVNAIKLLYSGPAEYLRMRRGALDLITRNHSPHRFIQRLSEVFEISSPAKLSSTPDPLRMAGSPETAKG